MRKGINVQETSHDGLPDVSDISILSVDDDSVNHFVIEELMSSNGCKVTKAMDAREALDILHEIYLDKGTEGFPDVVLMDQRMPHMTGLEATKIIRQRYPSSKMPIIMLSANNDEESVCEGLTVGCNDYVSKPFKRLELLARISLQVRMLRYHQREVEARQNERILTEILPKSVIERLKNGTTRIADKLDNVTILFSDIVGFTSLTASVSTIDIISMLDDLFSKFDTLVEHHGVYKVETIGASVCVRPFLHTLCRIGSPGIAFQSKLGDLLDFVMQNSFIRI